MLPPALVWSLVQTSYQTHKTYPFPWLFSQSVHLCFLVGMILHFHVHLIFLSLTLDEFYIRHEYFLLMFLLRLIIFFDDYVLFQNLDEDARSPLSFFSFDSPYLFFVVPFVFDVMLVLLLPLILFVQ